LSRSTDFCITHKPKKSKSFRPRSKDENKYKERFVSYICVHLSIVHVTTYTIDYARIPHAHTDSDSRLRAQRCVPPLRYSCCCVLDLVSLLAAIVRIPSTAVEHVACSGRFKIVNTEEV